MKNFNVWVSLGVIAIIAIGVVAGSWLDEKRIEKLNS